LLCYIRTEFLLRSYVHRRHLPGYFLHPHPPPTPDLVVQCSSSTNSTGAPPPPQPSSSLPLEQRGGEGAGASGRGSAEEEAEGTWVWAYHGTASENLHSILCNGLRVFSGTRHEANGSIFGDGVYFAEDPGVSFGFTRATRTWPGTSLFIPDKGYRVMLVGRVRKECEDSKNAGSTNGVPAKYLVVKDPAAEFRLKYVLFYAEHSEGRSGSAMTFLYLFYASLLVFL
jgi:hypothetical protein